MNCKTRISHDEISLDVLAVAKISFTDREIMKIAVEKGMIIVGEFKIVVDVVDSI